MQVVTILPYTAPNASSALYYPIQHLMQVVTILPYTAPNASSDYITLYST